ncbi:unnamed protein product [Porites lobata]|uniref:Uncharacterized protein n=1 Tax=Porites lobata TaxID=104759 RepID=A0ABN8RPF1_9CNID|nr:unnamed protein product [Porites lobata]
MSLAPKIDEVKCVISDVNPDLAFFTWLRDSISENHLHIPWYNFTARNRTTDHHGGVGFYIKTTSSSSLWTIYKILILKQ